MIKYLHLVLFYLHMFKANAELKQDQSYKVKTQNESAEPSFVTARVRMRDSIELAIDYFLPSGEDQYPCIVEITPYGRTFGKPNFRYEADYWTVHGYAFVIADFRGTGESGGEFSFHLYDGRDGYDLIEWIARQPWSNGRIGMRGASYSGEIQWQTARERPPHLLCITPNMARDRPMRALPYENGGFSLAWALSWIGTSLNVARPDTLQTHSDPLTWLNHRPLRTLDVFAVGRELPLYRTFLDHPTYDDFWRFIDLFPSDYARIDIPSLAFTGWFDSTLPGTVRHFQNIRRFSDHKAHHFLIIGPYAHGTAAGGGRDFERDQPILNIGDFPVPENGFLPARDMTRQFYEWCLKDKPQPNWKTIRIYVTGSNNWMTLDRFPPEHAYEKSLYLASDGYANTMKGNGRLQWQPTAAARIDHYQYDPNNPLVIDMNEKPYALPVDINNLLNRNDVLVYTSEILNKSLTLIGNVIVELAFSTTVRDTDVVIQLMDVMPDGRSIKLCSNFNSQLRLRYREGFDREVLMTPDKIYLITIDMNQIGHTFLPQHRIRLAVTSSFYPWLHANPNTGGPVGDDVQLPIVANQTIHYSFMQPSRIRMMVVNNPIFGP